MKNDQLIAYTKSQLNANHDLAEKIIKYLDKTDDQTTLDDIEITFGREGVTCGSGDKFVTSAPKLQTDIVDMEAFAIAKVCKLENIDFRCFKFISDNADNEAKNDWVENVSFGSKVFINTINKLENQ